MTRPTSSLPNASEPAGAPREGASLAAIGGRPAAAPTEEIDVSEKGRSATGEVISLDRRLYMQFMAFGGCRDTQRLIDALAAARLHGALYADINDPQGVGLVTYSETPDYFLTDLRNFFNQPPFAELTPKPEHTMLGRTYALGYEQDLYETLIGRPRSRVVDPKLPWVIWYPLRRAGSFEQLSPQEQNGVLMEHGGIGRAFGRVGLGYDIRLACHGLDKNDNDFVVALLGPELHPLSSIVQRMRKTKQTSLHLEHLGPFFIGKVLWQSALEA
ncbi:MAG: chlorite dismutase family protein [Caldilineaceae bacterium]|nr:chlorite dismutase family protein [Caldilineaceae bacterium]